MDQPEAAADFADRVSRLLDAVVAVGSGLELQVVLGRIVEVAISLVDATYGALGVVDQGGRGLSQFITVGIDEATVARIGLPPTGHGVLGEVIRRPVPMRLLHLADHPASSGFPEVHPPMQTFLGVPVRVGPTVFGNLYLTEKRSGTAFSDEDEAVVVALALAAGVAIQNARLYAESRRRGAWMDAGREVSTSLLSGTEREDVLALVVERACSVLEADIAFLVVAAPDGPRLEATTGDRGTTLVADFAAELRQVLETGHSQGLHTAGMFGTAVPLGPYGQGASGALVALWGQRPAGEVSVGLSGFAAQAAVALELADRRGEAERSALVQDRDRIGRDLHDLVIQRLFATGMQLQSVTRLVTQDPTEAVVRINRAVDELDATIRELRSTIYGLQAPMAEQPSLRAQLLEVVDAAGLQLGFAPSLRLDGLLDTLPGPVASAHVVATLREALSNVARHAAAHRVDVLVAVQGDVLSLSVEDDGCGLDADISTHGNGLRNLAARAAELDGSMQVVAGPSGGGTTLRWSVPV